MSIRLLAAAFFGLVACAHAQPSAPAPTPSVVYAVHNPAAIERYRVNEAVVRGMVDRLVIAATGQPDVARAWRSLVSPGDKVGIKINAAGGALFTTHRGVVNAIADGLTAAGVPRGNIIVWDRQLTSIAEAGYRVRGEGYQLVSIDGRNGYDSKAPFSAGVLGTLIWGDRDYVPREGENPLNSETKNTSTISYFADVLNRVTKIINVPVMSDSTAAGLAGCLYNLTLPNIDNWRRFTQFGPMGAGGIAEIYADDRIRKKVVLNIMDGLVAAYAGGPDSHPNFAVHHATLLASKDPVAIDSIALKRIEQWRAAAKLPPVGEVAMHVEIAAQMGLGNADPKRIELRNLPSR